MWNTEWRLNAIISHPDWKCTKRANKCKSQVQRPSVEFTIEYEVEAGESKTYDCSQLFSQEGYEIRGIVTIECDLGAATYDGECFKRELAVQRWIEVGPGVCRDSTLTNTGTGIGPGRSPPNFSRWMGDNETEQDCRAACEHDTFSQLCIGISYYENNTKLEENMEVGEKENVAHYG
eukprot:UN32257